MDLLALTLGAAAGALAHRLATETREYRKDSQGLADLLSWESAVADGVVALRDGALLTAWSYQGGDMGSATVHERNVLSRHLNEALRPFGDGWMMHVDAVRRRARGYAESGAFPDPLTRLIDEERRRAYEGRAAHAAGFFETDYVLAVTYAPAEATYDRLGRFFIRGTEVAERLDALVEAFEVACHGLEARLDAHLRMRRLTTEELLTHLHFCLTGLQHPVTAPALNLSLGSYLADQPVYGGFRPVVGDRHVRLVSVHGFPQATTHGMLEALHTYPGRYRWSSRLILLSNEAAARLVKGKQMMWFKKRRGLGAVLRDMAGGGQRSERDRRNEEEYFQDEAAKDMTRDAALALKRIAAATERYGLYTSTLVVMEDDAERADGVAAGLQKVLQDAGFPARLEDVNAFEAYLGSLPGHGWPNLRRHVIHTRNVADLFPSTKVWAGAEFNQSPLFPEQSPALMWTKTEGSTPFRVNLHAQGDVGHTLVVGATGAGKSVLVGTTIAQWFRYPKAQVFLFDVGYSGYLLARGAGARHYDLAAAPVDEGDAGRKKPSLQLQPLAHIDDPAELAWATSWLETLLELQGVAVTPERRHELARALRLLAREAPRHRTLRELKIQVQDEALSSALAPFVQDGTYGFLLDGDADTLDEDLASEAHGNPRYQVFELANVRELSEQVFVPLLLYLFRRVERRLAADRPTLIVLEEVWAALLESAFAERIRQWLLTLRKQNAAVMLVAHAPSQIAELESREIIIESCPTKIFLPNPDAVEPENRRLYQAMGLNDREITLIAQATRRRDYFFKCPAGSRLFDLNLGPLALSFLAPPGGQSVGQLRRKVDTLVARYGAEWVYHWLLERGQPGWAEAFLEAVGRSEQPHVVIHGAEERTIDAAPHEAHL